ncbi:hypothetical protein KY495_00400 [Massilia sp. PAMC28688]|uniref:hypothetical protein n=1 Tax=Massilia sp. PAMC28688 TaxID=2861283 RepID=UPI001C63764F|nr:hypothetical protein [Massilia sp. PAMC28688]QYF93738.1 hypothetical protein KY495_00400 [Massilia sp. PAMC28688]
MSVQRNDLPPNSGKDLDGHDTDVAKELRSIWHELGVIHASMANMVTKQELAEVRQELKGELTQLREATKAGFVEQQAMIDARFAEHRLQAREDVWSLRADMKTMQAENRAAIADSRAATVTWVACIVFIGQLIPVLVRVAERYV